jgi:hypothetical protein
MYEQHRTAGVQIGETRATFTRSTAGVLLCCLVAPDAKAERYPGLAAELVALLVELIVALGTPASVAAKRATETIPIVVQTGDPVAAGLVRDLAHPGPKDHQDEVTGMTDLWRWSASDLARAIRTRQVSSRDAVHACLTRIEQVNPRINAIVECRTEEALAGADAADAAVAGERSSGHFTAFRSPSRSTWTKSGMRQPTASSLSGTRSQLKTALWSQTGGGPELCSSGAPTRILASLVHGE